MDRKYNRERKLFFLTLIILFVSMNIQYVAAYRITDEAAGGTSSTIGCTSSRTEDAYWLVIGTGISKRVVKLGDRISPTRVWTVSKTIDFKTTGQHTIACWGVEGRGIEKSVNKIEQVIITVGSSTSPTPSPTTYYISTAKTGDGTGLVTGAGTYNQGSTVTLRADAYYGSTFVSWSGVTCSQGNTNRECTITVTGARTATARFDLNDYTLTLSKSGSGTITGGGISTSSTSRTVQLPHGYKVTVNAQPSSGYSFSHWSGDCTGSGICQFNMQRDMGVHANFIKNEGTLYLATTGTGYGRIEGAGTTCSTPSICPITVNVGQAYNIVATASPGSTLTKLEGCTLTGSNTCTITIPEGSTIRTVTATFDYN